MKLNIYASVEEHDQSERRRLLKELNLLQIMPAFKADKIEFRYYGERETVMELGELAGSFTAHSIQVWGG